jgi:hypothetical protein
MTEVQIMSLHGSQLDHSLNGLETRKISGDPEHQVTSNKMFKFALLTDKTGILRNTRHVSNPRDI